MKKKLTVFAGLAVLLFFPAGCSQQEEVKPEVSAEGVDPLMLQSDLDVALNLDFNPAYLIRKDQLAFEFSQALRPGVGELIEIGKNKLAKYNIAPEQVSYDPKDPVFAVAAMVIDQLEFAYANGYEVQFVEDSPVVPVTPEGLSAVGQCAMDAAGLTGFVHLVQSGVSGAGLNAGIALRVIGKVTVRGALGWIGAGWVAYEFGKCLQKANVYSIPYGSLSLDERERIRIITDQLTHTRTNFVDIAGDTAIHILNQYKPI